MEWVLFRSVPAGTSLAEGAIDMEADDSTSTVCHQIATLFMHFDVLCILVSTPPQFHQGVRRSCSERVACLTQLSAEN